MSANYETVYIVKGDMAEDGLKKLNDRIGEVLSRKGGKIVGLNDLGVKALAYRIERQTKGRYFELKFEGGGEAVDELEKNLRLSEECLRFLTVRLQPQRETEGERR